jgi:hypothetical protein
MKTPAGNNGVRERPLQSLQSGAVRIHEDQATGLARSTSLKSSYSATFIVLVLFIAAILGLTLIFWPSGSF